MPGNELSGIDQFLLNRLAADAPLIALLGGTAKLYSEMAPQKTSATDTRGEPPFVLWTFLSGVDRNALPASERILVRPLVLVRAVTQAQSFASADAIADRIEAALVGASGTAEGGALTILGMHREELIRFVEISEGRRINHVGGRYRALAHTT